MTSLLSAAHDLVTAIQLDDTHSGGLLSRSTIHRADELRLALYHFQPKDTTMPNAHQKKVAETSLSFLASLEEWKSSLEDEQADLDEKENPTDKQADRLDTVNAHLEQIDTVIAAMDELDLTS